jgi:hypothetical protein
MTRMPSRGAKRRAGIRASGCCFLALTEKQIPRFARDDRRVLRSALCALTACGVAACAPALSSGSGPDPRAVQPERPSVATHAGTVAPGYLEIETGAERDRNPDRSHAFAIPTVLKIGIAPRAQLSLFLPLVSATGVPLGIGDVAAGVKWRLVDGDGPLQRFAILPSVKLSSGGDRGTRTTDASILLIDSRTIGPVSLDLNVGLTRRSGDGSAAPRTATVWTASSALPLGGGVGWQLECFGYPGTHGPGGNAPTVAILTGPTLGVSRSLAVDAGVIVPVTGEQPRAVYAGLVTNLGLLFRGR